MYRGDSPFTKCKPIGNCVPSVNNLLFKDIPLPPVALGGVTYVLTASIVETQFTQCLLNILNNPRAAQTADAAP